MRSIAISVGRATAGYQEAEPLGRWKGGAPSPEGVRKNVRLSTSYARRVGENTPFSLGRRVGDEGLERIA